MYYDISKVYEALNNVFECEWKNLKSHTIKYDTFDIQTSTILFTVQRCNNKIISLYNHISQTLFIPEQYYTKHEQIINLFKKSLNIKSEVFF